jgi:hypothetical protein
MQTNIYYDNLYKDINTKGIKQSYGTRPYFRLMLNGLNIMGVLLLCIPFCKPSLRKLPWRFPYAHKETFLKVFLIVNEL